MALVWYYESELDGASTEIVDRVRLYTMDVAENAEEGSVALSTVTIDDPLGDYSVTGWRRIRAFEDTAGGSNTHIWSGFVGPRDIKRGPFKVPGPGRQWVVSCVDENAVLGLRVLSIDSANRPAETDVARVQWLLTVLGTPNIPITEFLSTAGPVNMDAVDYRGQTRQDVLNDCAQASGKNYYVYTKDTTFFDLDLGLWYGKADNTDYTSSIRLTNDYDDVRNDARGFTFAIADDTELHRSPERVFSGAYIQYDGGTVYEEDIGTSNEFTRRDAVVPAENVKTQAKATARALRYLADMDVEDDRITTAVRLPAEKVNWIRKGMRLEFKATHLPGYEAYVWMRVLQRKILQDSEEEYLLTLELTNPDPAGGSGDGGGAAPAEDQLEPLVGLYAEIVTPNDGNSLPNTSTLYKNCTYRVDYTVVHTHAAPATTSNYISVHLQDSFAQVLANKNMGRVADGTALTAYTTEFTTGDWPQGSRTIHVWIAHTPYVNRDGTGSNVRAKLYYVSGPDPRFS